MKIHINLNDTKLKKAINQYTKKGNNNKLKKVIRTVNLYLKNEVMAETPVDTGLLRSSFNTDFSEINSFKASLINPVEYAIYVHNGTKWQKSNPFITRTIKKRENQIMEIVKKGLS